ncbi:MAG: ABC transporter ATP-binding protein/permease [Planctomycetes bacterium]|nr:ABC transporter ATP-binding protein/permease [Planctomycetota bacterium]
MKGSPIRLKPLVLPHGKGLAGVVALVLVGILLGLLTPWPLKLAIDSVLGGQPLPGGFGWLRHLPGASTAGGLLVWLGACGAAIFLAHWTVQLVQSALQTAVGSRLTYALAAHVFDRLQRLPLSFHHRQATGDLVRRVSHDATCLQQVVLGVVVPAVTAVGTLGAMAVILWNLDPVLTGIALMVAVPLAAIIRWCLGPVKERRYEQRQLEGQMMAFAERTLTTLPAVQAFGREDLEETSFRQLSKHTLRAYLQALVAQLQFGARVNGTLALGTAVVMVLGGLRVLEGALTVGSLLVFLAYVHALYAPVAELAHLSTGYATAAAGFRRVREVLDEASRESSVENREPAVGRGTRVEGQRPETFSVPLASVPQPSTLNPQPSGCVRFENVTFGYEPNRPVLQDITLEARPGEMIALVGHTGAGKSTLVSLIPRLFDPWDGRVLIDGVDVRDFSLSELRSRISIVLQDPYLLPLSIADTIAWGAPGASRRRIEAAAIAANADEFIRRLPAAYETVIGERGCTLSGGQKQRLAIARALCRDADVVILDEPTAALDALAEGSLMESFEHLTRERTTFVIAHRLSTIRRADRIVVLENGRLAELPIDTQAAGTDGKHVLWQVGQRGDGLARFDERVPFSRHAAALLGTEGGGRHDDAAGLDPGNPQSLGESTRQHLAQ